MTKLEGHNNLTKELAARIDALKKIPLKTNIIIAISIASFFTYYDITNYSYISPVLKKIWGIGDMSPKSKRGKYTSIIILIGWAGLTSSGPISFLLVQQGQVMGIESWRIVMAIA